eukprot:TRINITY_DN34091_c0_g1_i1.p2 TRINITY_DN34091_c0_g1~~TRINITY_DN34091_c0_g1_i1.p2  ORF type:complete len:232 (-),score=36.04 TRINITY_DN34091_c0_g1_i1:205-819(-)
MRFAFCGGLDVPDWFLAAIAILAKLSAIRLKVLSAQVLKISTGADDTDFNKVTKFANDAKLSDDETKQTINALSFVLLNAVRFTVDDTTLSNELTMLGLPKESAEAVARAYRESREAATAHAVASTVQLPAVTDVSYRVDTTIASSDVRTPTATVALTLHTEDRAIAAGGSAEVGAVQCEVSHGVFRALHRELQNALAQIDKAG